jgi:hypothetical protein
MPPLEMERPSVEMTQGDSAWADVGVGILERQLERPRQGDRRRTIVALVSASVISMLVWGLIVVLHVQ